MIKVQYINTLDYRSEQLEFFDIDALKTHIFNETEEFMGFERDDEQWQEPVIVKHKAEHKDHKDVYYEKGFGNLHLWIVL